MKDAALDYDEWYTFGLFQNASAASKSEIFFQFIKMNVLHFSSTKNKFIKSKEYEKMT